MRRIAHRELRNDSSTVLEAVKNGEFIEVTNGGELVAILVPPGTSTWDQLVLAGKVKPATADFSRLFAAVPLVRSPLATAGVLDELRGDT